MPHIVVCITGHGYGHVAQTAPILNQLHISKSQFRLTVRSSVPVSHLRSRIHAPFAHLSSEGDIGMVMSSALDVIIRDSCEAYRELHAEWDARITAEANLLHELKADLVLSNVGYLPLAGAQRAGITNAALCSLNWYEIYRHYCGNDAIASQIKDCYARADAFLSPTPSMSMPYLPNLIEVGPIAHIGNDRRDELNRHLRLSRDEKLVLVSMGGIASRLPMEGWPRIDGVHWLVQADWNINHPDVVVLESLPLGFSDLLASCDAFLCKPGYGSFTEAVCSGKPVLYVPRPDWPESQALIEWLQRHGVCCEVSRQTLERGEISKELESLWMAQMTYRQTASVTALGAAQVKEWLVSKLDG